jgi:cytosine/adenosine deaminase-related metal-dependent hydrolase
VHLSDVDVARIAGTETAVAWCPTSNLRLGSGLAPVRALLDGGAAVGLAVDGSASNDSGHMLAEVRQAMLVARGRDGAGAMPAREALRLATRGGARCLGRDDIGSLEAGKRGDVALFRLDGLGDVGAEVDPVAALLFCQPRRVTHLIVDGRPVVREGTLLTLDEQRVAEDGRRAARRAGAVSGRAR